MVMFSAQGFAHGQDLRLDARVEVDFGCSPPLIRLGHNVGHLN
jgi:hypothetical protein